METIAANAMVFVPFVGQRIDVGALRHGGVEGGIEHGHMGNSWQV